ncbi:Fucose permease (FucP) (PDB:3O7P) [Commensalibacter communis]|uniref:Fucose permease (FucP) n=1 Tax=Commensalibacter communis TaxID=2972786 RepID=A0A9W4X6Q5_9PROT|nr:glucose/galactose MFS transporter [Commensalibacter communis]CAI3933058.1 Fucose permease (FucP) (PDB:3O7P) [Commensalibacter communis]CAI3942793.1 Fucose permease (FucP) (PDB:3O7P) [Commensalibacter communis]CAI3951768.1 Fucose permease (FucP) (PDB:3O7P) [Commensalibacter communis]CAI3953375.1 Fucose permease (FucP) (PDB:3O7P) [Commensalibacter communis]CAI3960558.1 Fucose permease (FucP) (PDB:3O7P) [Commensalibacter communis]
MSNSSSGASDNFEARQNSFTYYPVALSVMTTVFFMWGFLTCLNDILIPHLKTVFELNYAQAMLVQFTFFGAYFLMSIPGGKIVSSLGYKKGIVTGLIIAAIGAFGFWPAAISSNYYIFLLALFILATGITILQVAANPYVTLLGSQKTSSSRLNLAQAFNALGTTVAPYLGGILILVGASYTLPKDVATAPETIQLISTLENKPTTDIQSAFNQAKPENVAYALKNIPPFIFNKLSNELLLEQANRLPPEILGTVLSDIPTEQKLYILSNIPAEKLEQLPADALVQSMDGLVTTSLDPNQTNMLQKLKSEITPAAKQKMQEYRNNQAKSVQKPYAILGIILLLLAGFVAIFKLPENKDQAEESKNTPHSLKDVFQYPHAVLGALGIFFYVGAEVSVGSFMISYLTLPDIGRMTEQVASQYVAFFWGGAMVGRVIGSALMVKISPRKLLSLCAIVNLCLLVITMLSSGNVAVYSIISIGLFNSIMFPTIFSLAITGMGILTEQASSLVVMAIVGGAVIPFAQGFIADSIGLHHAFLLPLLCYVYILYYGVSGAKPSKTVIEQS